MFTNYHCALHVENLRLNNIFFTVIHEESSLLNKIGIKFVLFNCILELFSFINSNLIGRE